MAYTVLDLTTAVQDDLKDTSFSSSRILRYLNAGQRLIFNTHMFRFCEKAYTGTLADGASSKTQQTDHQTTIGGSIVDPASSGIYTLLNEHNYLPHREFFERNPNVAAQSEGIPNYWTEFGGTMYFDRPTDKEYTFYQRYIRVPTELTANADVPELPEAFRELLELYADFRSEKYRGNHDVAATYKQEFEDGLESMALRFGEATQAGSYVMGSERVHVDA